jgi:prepilin-type N-terminal cleavage/methylation domain-containing protein
LRDDRGETLIELLVAIMIMGVGVVVLLGGLATSIRMSALHREQALAGAQVRAYAEAIETTVAASPSSYVVCAGTATYGATYVPGPTYTARVTAVRYWDGSAFVTTCAPATDSGVQQLTLSVSSADGFVDETLVVVIRKPCRSLTDYPADAPCG